MKKLDFTEIDKPRGHYLDEVPGNPRYLFTTNPAFVDYLDALAAFVNRASFPGNSLEIFDQTRKSWILYTENRENIFYLNPICIEEKIYFASLDFSKQTLEIKVFNPDSLEEASCFKASFTPELAADFALMGPDLCLYSRNQKEQVHIYYPFEGHFFLEEDASISYFDGQYFYGHRWHEEENGDDNYDFYESLQIRDKEGQVQFEKQGCLYQLLDGDFVLI